MPTLRTVLTKKKHDATRVDTNELVKVIGAFQERNSSRYRLCVYRVNMDCGLATPYRHSQQEQGKTSQLALIVCPTRGETQKAFKFPFKPGLKAISNNSVEAK